jgi:hypothetical protein
VGYNADSTHAHRIYWPEKNSVSIECNVKFTSTAVTITAEIPTFDVIVPAVPTAQALSPTLQAPPATLPAPLPASVPVVHIRSPPQPPPGTSSGEEEKTDEEDAVSTQPTPASKKVKAARALSTTQGTCQSAWHSKPSDYMRRLASGEGSVDRSPAVPASFSMDDASGKSASAVNAHPDTGPQEYALYAGLEDVMAAAIQDAEGDPKTLQEAQSCTDWPSWKAVMDCEMETLEKAVTWKPVI